MKIANKNKSNLAQLISKKEVPFQGNKTRAAKAGSTEGNVPAKVTLSPRSQNFKMASEIARKDHVNEAKINRLQTLIDSGKYDVDAAKIADRLVDEHMKMPT